MYSQLALKLYALKREGIIKSNTHFWREFSCGDLETMDVDTTPYESELNKKGISLICVYDESFPSIPNPLKNSEKPFLFAYKGDIALLEDKSKNIAVVGVLTPTQEIIERERKIVEGIIKKGFCIVSGLANGCDTVAHEECLLQNGKTVAFLPTTLDNIYPKQNVNLADRIVKSGGLVITEYITEPQNRFEGVKRFIERDRLQAMFAKGIILIASYLQGRGDSGSRHAMQKAKEYGAGRFVMYNEDSDSVDPMFGLNRQLLENGATILTPKILHEFS